MRKRIIEAVALLLGLVLLLAFPPQPTEVNARLVTIQEEPLVIPEKEEPIVVVECEEVKTSPYTFISLDDDLQVYMESLCADMELDFFLCAALMESESAFKENAVSKDGKDIGLFQIRASVWEDYFKELGLNIYDTRDNIECGLLIIKKLCDKYPDETALQCYKCGESRGLELMKDGFVLSSIQNILDRRDEWKRKEP